MRSNHIEPTLTDLVGLRALDDPWPVTPTSTIEQPSEGNSHYHYAPPTLESTRFYNNENIKLWRYCHHHRTSNRSKELKSQLRYPMGDAVVAIDPWDIPKVKPEPPFYRRFWMELESAGWRMHTTDASSNVDPGAPCHPSQGEHRKMSIGSTSYNASPVPLHSHL